MVDSIEDFAYDNVALNLEILAEECAEVIQMKSKIIRFDIDDYHPKNKVTNRKALIQELGDLLAMIDILESNGLFTQKDLNKAKLIKLNKLRKWYDK